MKRTLCLSALFVVCATIAVSGQSMNEKLQQLLGGSHSAKQEEVDGTYSYDPATGTAAITLIQDGKQATFQGYLSLRGEVLTLQFDAGDALEAVRHSSPEYAANEKMQQIASVMQNYPGIMLGGQLKK